VTAIPEGVELAKVLELAPDRQLQASRLIREALPDYYGSIPLSEAGQLDAITAQFGLGDSELGFAMAALLEGSVVGVYSVVAASSLGMAQLVGTTDIMRRLDREGRAGFRQRLADYGREFAPPLREGTYCSRLTIASTLRKRGFGIWLLGDAISRTPFGNPISAHIHQDNQASQRMAAHQGFRLEGEPAPYGLWVRRAGSGTS
jgi:hypothetical protein